MLASIATEFGTEVETFSDDMTRHEVEFHRPLQVKKLSRAFPDLTSIEKFGLSVVEGVGSLIYAKGTDPDGEPIYAPAQLLSFTDRVRILRRAVYFVEHCVKDK